MPNGYPDLKTAEMMLEEAGNQNSGPWMEHSRNVALAAKNIAESCPALDSGKAYVLGLLHDIGRREGPRGMSHTIDGYRICMSHGYPQAARICMTHSFPGGNIGEAQGEWESTEDCQTVERFLAQAEYNDYDRLIQLCDALALPSGFSLIEKRLVDVALRHGVNEFMQSKWKAFFEIKSHFESVMQKSVYDVLPGVVENTFCK